MTMTFIAVCHIPHEKWLSEEGAAPDMEERKSLLSMLAISRYNAAEQSLKR